MGSGKTSSLPTFIRTGIDLGQEYHLAVVITEPNGVESLLDGVQLHAPKGMDCLPIERLHYCYIPPAVGTWKTMISTAKQVNTLKYSAITKLATARNQDFEQFIRVLENLNDFRDQRGDSLGAIDTWDTNWMLAIDSLSGINKMARQLHTGTRPSIHQGEWGVSMAMVEQFFDQLVAVTKCYTCTCAHPTLERDELTGTTQYMPDFLGRKLSPKVPRIFSEVILQQRDDRKFTWATMQSRYSSLKARNLPLSSNLMPSFKPLVRAWQKRAKLVSQTPPTLSE